LKATLNKTGCFSVFKRRGKMRNFLVVAFGVVFGVILAVLLKLDGLAYWVCLIVSMFIIQYIFSGANLSKQKIKTEYGFIRPAMAYKVNLSIEVNPKAILGESFKEGSEGYHFIEKILNDPQIEADREDSFLGKVFNFTLIRDEISGLAVIYDCNNKEFIDEIQIYGYFLRCNAEKLKQKYNIESSLINTHLVLEDCALGYTDKWAPLAGMDKPVSHGIPTDMIIEALNRLKVYWGNPMMAIKKFNKTLQEYLDKEKIEYDTSNIQDFGIGTTFQGKEMDKKYARLIKKHTGLEVYDEHLNYHLFKGEHVIASIAIKFMDKMEFV